MPADYTVIAVEQSKGEPDYHGNIAYWIEVQNGESDAVRALMMQRPGTPPPTPGLSLYGRLEAQTSKRGNDYHRFYKEQREDSGPSAHSQNAGSGSQGRGIAADSRSHRIERQHSQEMAIRLMAAFEPVTEGRTAKAYLEVVRSLTDHFCQDVNNYAEALGVPTPSPGTGAGVSSEQADASQGAVPASPPIGGAAPNLSGDDVKIALALAGATDISDPAAAYQALSDGQRETFSRKLAELKATGETSVGDSVPDDPSVPF